jgi:hypothetical protein
MANEKTIGEASAGLACSKGDTIVPSLEFCFFQVPPARGASGPCVQTFPRISKACRDVGDDPGLQF